MWIMSLLEQLRKAKAKLKIGETRVLTADGRELVEKRDAEGAVVTKEVGVRAWGFVGDMKPDLQVAEIIPGLMLSSQDVAQDLELLTQHQISHVLNAASGVPNFYEDRLKYLKLNICDLPSTDILSILPESFKFIRRALSDGGRVLVHCNAGVSRSTTIVVAYLMRYEKMNVRVAMEHVRTIRPCVRPNDGFVRQLFDYESALRFERSMAAKNAGKNNNNNNNNNNKIEKSKSSGSLI